MNQTGNNNDLKSNLDMLMKGLEGLTNNLEATVTSSFKNMGTNEAEQFAKAMKDNNIPDRIKEIKDSIPELNRNMKFD